MKSTFLTPCVSRFTGRVTHLPATDLWANRRDYKRGFQTT